MSHAPKIYVAKCAICHESISALENDDVWLHNLGGFKAAQMHEPEAVPESIRPLYAYPGLADAEPG